MAGIDYAAVRQRIAICRVLQLIDYRPASQRGDQWRGRCPINSCVAKEEGDRSFSVHTTRHMFQCFRCRQSGNQLDLWAAIIRRPLHEATIDLCRQLGVEIPRLPSNGNAKIRPR